MEELFPVRLVDMPVNIHSFVQQADDGTSTIVLNARLSCELLRKCYWHEVEHIIEGDLDTDGSADVIELCRHNHI